MNDLIRQAIAAEAEERVDSRTVLANLHKAKKRKPFGLIVGVATLTVAAAVAAVVIPTTLKKTDASPAAQTPAAQNVLLIGTDEYHRTDALVFARFEGDGSATVISLPRDIYVGSGPDRINSLYMEDPRKLTDAVEQMTGAKVDHYAAINMSAFGQIAAAVGGVEVCLSAPAKDPRSGTDLPAGRQLISGDQALAFLRQRFDLTGGDLDRAKRHQAFLAGLAAKITKDNALMIARQVSGTIQVDQGWDVAEFAARFQGPVKIRTTTLPVGEPVQRDGTFGFAVDPAQAKQFVETQFNGEGPVRDGCVY
ncbi:cell envelope-related function transcriptional attenuator common domain-containing protein [Lentzea waywayandensis]|uniref:Cell envelope-related function transcriptional attenuator common domain-containing protein n=1 Tax=Lentzea waywayandensis TaxID=84724 RepID=A0A1I6E1S5_9PSEU|nr:LCP family protein [Lentzea waywayandensis]SFR11577.1 cell envelope-related function transcriptional attenuator common domain-containing protein [Lentzea waywayandensis]